MADNAKNREWSTRVGHIKDGKVEEFKTENGKEGLRAVIVNKDNKENFVVAFTDAQKERLREAAASDAPMVIRGPAFFNKDRESFVMANTVRPQGEPGKELSEEEKAKVAEKVAERDKTRVPVVEGSVETGATITAGGAEVTVSRLSKAWELDTEEKVAALAERFPDVDGIVLGAKVQYAIFDAPEAKKDLDQEEEPAGPGM